jgi:N-acetylmuramic acid 6-phosphate etherase
MKNYLIIFLTIGCAIADYANSGENIQEKTNTHLDLTILPPDFLTFEEFEKEFRLGTTSTEQLNPITKTLSQTTHKNISAGLNLLLDVDENVIRGLEAFIPIIELQAPPLADKIKKGGRVFLIGSGSSGRVAIDIAAKCTLAFPEIKQQIRGMIAGGDSALIRAKEGFEDSESDGKKALEEYKLGTKDTVILISASGSASFNVGCGQFSADQGATVLYFYNSKVVPTKTENLFNRNKNPVIPLCIDIGPQAIAGSTRLQGASLAEAGLGAFLTSALYLNRGDEDLARKYPHEIASKLRDGILLIRKQVNSLEKFVSQEKEIFSDPHSNFRQLKDLSNQGYVTFIALDDSMREVLIDSTETSPTFSTNPIRRESESHKKRAEFQAYLVKKNDNREAWKAVLGREIYQEDLQDTDAFLLSSKADGLNSYQNRPLGQGNFLIGVAKLKEFQQPPQEIMYPLEQAKKQGAQAGLLLICRGKLSKEQVDELRDFQNTLFIIENIPYEPIGLVETIILKQALNLISNGSMILMNKIHGNQMIDVRASNKKLIDRCIRLIKEIWNEYHPDLPLSDKELYHYIAHVAVIKKTYEEKGVYTPAVVKIILAMVSLKKSPEDFQEVVDFLNEKQERIEWIAGE